jgi:hypothetical protein
MIMHSEATLATLDDLSEEDWVLHGSPYSCDNIQPADPHQDHLIPEFNRKAVYGTCLVELAVLYATVRAPRADWGWQLINEPEYPHIMVVGPERLRLSMGYVHLVKRNDFTEFILNGLTCLSYIEVKSRKEIAVYPSMLELLIKQRRIVVMSYAEYKKQKE